MCVMIQHVHSDGLILDGFYGHLPCPALCTRGFSPYSERVFSSYLEYALKPLPHTV